MSLWTGNKLQKRLGTQGEEVGLDDAYGVVLGQESAHCLEGLLLALISCGIM